MTTVEDKMSRLFMSSAAEAANFLPNMSFDQCGSKIEMLMAAALWSRGVWTSRAVMSLEETVDALKEQMKGTSQGWHYVPVCVGQQIPIGQYRLDFLLVGEGFETGKFHMLAVECDGHDFHEKTKEQAARDKSRDRAIAAQDITTMRFTGAEIWRDAGKCADEVFSFFQKKWEDEFDISFRRHCREEHEKFKKGQANEQQQ